MNTTIETKPETSETQPTLSERDSQRISKLQQTAQGLIGRETAICGASDKKKQMGEDLARIQKDKERLLDGRDPWSDLGKAIEAAPQMTAAIEVMGHRLNRLSKAAEDHSASFLRALAEAGREFAAVRNDVHRERFCLAIQGYPLRPHDDQIQDLESRIPGIRRLRPFNGNLATAQDFADVVTAFEAELLTDTQERTAVSPEEANQWRWKVAPQRTDFEFPDPQPARPNFQAPGAIALNETSIDLNAANRESMAKDQRKDQGGFVGNSVDFSENPVRGTVNQQGEDTD